jgi:predicted type IV restriction endonuclease
MALPKKVEQRMISGLKRLLPVVEQQKARDVSEADTVTLVKEVLSEVFGYDKFAELTGEMAIRGTYCDLATKLDGKVTQLIEVKAIGIELDDRHVKQVVDYAANHGIEWVILTNARIWRLYNVLFSKPIDKRLICQIDLATINPRAEHDQEQLYLFAKEGFLRGAHVERRDRQDATSRYILAALLLNNSSVLSIVRRELKRVVDVNVNEVEILHVLRDEVIKRDALEGPQADKAMSKITRRESRPLRERRTSSQAAPAEFGTVPSPQEPVEEAAQP